LIAVNKETYSIFYLETGHRNVIVGDNTERPEVSPTTMNIPQIEKETNVDTCESLEANVSASSSKFKDKSNYKNVPKTSKVINSAILTPLPDEPGQFIKDDKISSAIAKNQHTSDDIYEELPENSQIPTKSSGTMCHTYSTSLKVPQLPARNIKSPSPVPTLVPRFKAKKFDHPKKSILPASFIMPELKSESTTKASGEFTVGTSSNSKAIEETGKSCLVLPAVAEYSTVYDTVDKTTHNEIPTKKKDRTEQAYANIPGGGVLITNRSFGVSHGMSGGDTRNQPSEDLYECMDGQKERESLYYTTMN